MRKLLLTVLLLLILITIPVCAHGWEWSLDDSGTLEISGTGPVEDFGSAEDTPWHDQTVRQVVVHEGITGLGSYAFHNCTSLTEVTLPDSLTMLGVSAFEGCKALKRVNLGTGLQTVEAYAFLDCSALTGVYITDVDAWCKAEFADYSSSPMYYAQALYVNEQPLSGVLELSFGVTKIPKYAFYGCEGLTKLKLPDSVTVIESDAFTYCSGLTEVDLGNGVTQVGSAAFSYCSALSGVSMGSKVTAVGNYAFAYCSGLETVELSGNLKELGQYAFYDCKLLKNIQLPQGLTTMGSYAFYGCSSLETVSIPESLTVIPAYGFRGCSGLLQLQLPDAVTTIEKYAFYGCTGLTSLTLPKALTTLGNYAFYNCSGLGEIIFRPTAMQNLSAGNYVFYKAGATGLSVTVAAHVTRIPAYLFYPYTTYGPGVARVVFERDSQCVEVGKYAFASCRSLKEVVFSGPVPTFGSRAFYRVTAKCLYPAFWDSGALESYGGTLIWLPIAVEAMDGTSFATFEEALAYSHKLRLVQTVAVNATLQQDLYIDLNGYDLSGTLSTGNYKVFGTDATTDGYSGEKAGTFCCTFDGKQVVPQSHVKVNSKRYLSVESQDGYSFHRFYLGITHMTLRPGQQGVGFKGVFYGDDEVCGQIAATGYTLMLEGFAPKSQWKNGAFASGTPIRLLLQHFDGEKYGETPLRASLCLQLKDGTVIESGYTMTLRGLMEQLSETPELLSDIQRQQIVRWIAETPVMEKWNIENLTA